MLKCFSMGHYFTGLEYMNLQTCSVRMSILGLAFVAKQVKPPPVTLAFHRGKGAVYVPADRLPIKLSANGLGKATKNGPSVWALATQVETWMEFLSPGFGLAKPWPSWTANHGGKISFSVSPTLTFK